MSTNQHARAALNDLRRANEASLDDGHAQMLATSALTEATLAVAEELRTANLLAFIADARAHGASGHDLVAVGEQVLTRLGLNEEA